MQLQLFDISSLKSSLSQDKQLSAFEAQVRHLVLQEMQFLEEPSSKNPSTQTQLPDENMRLVLLSQTKQSEESGPEQV